MWRFLCVDEDDDTVTVAGVYTESMLDTRYKATRLLKIYLKDQVFMYFGCTALHCYSWAFSSCSDCAA